MSVETPKTKRLIPTLTRRQILTGATLAAAAGAAYGQASHSALTSIALAATTNAPKEEQNALVVIFLRGGADGLNIVPPYFEDDYYRLRPALALRRPKEPGASLSSRALDLDGHFGLHPALSPLLPLFHDGKFAVVHAVGSGDQTRSHFEAMAVMERGLGGNTGASSGWLARGLQATQSEIESPLRAVAITETMPESLRGATNATALQNLSDYRLTTYIQKDGKPVSLPDSPRAMAMAASLQALYNDPTAGMLQSSGRETLKAIDAVRAVDPAHYRPTPGVHYPANELGSGMRQAACLIKSNVGLQVACLDLGGWDTHITQGRETGFQATRLSELGLSVAAFASDLGPALNRVTVLVMTEFGRRAYENTSLGTDHGRGSCMFAIGGGVNGGRVYTAWPGLSEDKLEDHGDLRVTTDYRDVLAELLSRRLNCHDTSSVFPHHTPQFKGVFRVS